MSRSAWHTMPSSDVCRTLKTDPQRGLSSQEAERRLREYGLNRLEDGQQVPVWSFFIKQFKDFLVLVLIAAAGISFFLGETYDALAILIIVVLNALMGFVQEYRAERSLQLLKRLSAPRATVLRDGRPQEVESSRLVPGDILFLESGARIPADCRLLETSGLETDESLLTGESVPVLKDASWIGRPAVELGDRLNMLYMGTTVTRGFGRAVVVATGMDSEVGQIAHLLQESGTEDTPLQKRLAQLGHYLLLACLAIVGLVFLTGLLSGIPLYNMFLTAVSLAVAAIPEGLPAAVTVALALGVQRMIRRNAIVRRLPAVETLGCATVICSDKTGTLTCNQMTVRSLWLADESSPVEVEGDGLQLEGRFLLNGRPVSPGRDPRLRLALSVAALCNHAQLVQERSGLAVLRKSRWSAYGDPTEVALKVAAAKGLGAHDLSTRWPLVSENPFDAHRRLMSVVCPGNIGQEGHAGDGQFSVLTKGAPDAVLARCSRLLTRSGVRELSGELRAEMARRSDQLARRGLRVLGLAWRPLTASGLLSRAEFPAKGRRGRGTASPESDGPRSFNPAWETDLIFLGLVAMYDPPRPEARDAIRAAQRAGIRTIMLTGDHPATAAYVAEALSLIRPGEGVVTGQDLDAWDDAQLQQRLESVNVFARVSPAHKLRIVRMLKRQGHVIAMTGDGVNDAPAIKEADIGIAMGQNGSDVTREASDMVLADDNFATIVAAVEEGRGIYANIRKFIRYLLTCNTGEILTMFLAVVAGWPLPLLPMQILWMNIVTDGLPAIALGMEKAEPGIMHKPPRKPDENLFAGGLHWRILYRGMLIGLSGLAGFALSLMVLQSSLEEARTVAFSVLVFAQLLFAFQCRSETVPLSRLGWTSNPALIWAVAVSAAMQLAVLYWPPLQVIFGTTALAGRQWLVVGALTMAGVVLDRGLKAARQQGTRWARIARPQSIG